MALPLAKNKLPIGCGRELALSLAKNKPPIGCGQELALSLAQFPSPLAENEPEFDCWIKFQVLLLFFQLEKIREITL